MLAGPAARRRPDGRSPRRCRRVSPTRNSGVSSSESSEPDGFFRSDNLLSNELGFQYVVPELAQTTKPGRVYMGVGPEQNFTYIVATKPAMAFIVDIRRGNLDLQLMYKALFELSADRAEFVSRLFSKKRPEGLTAKSTVLRHLRSVLERPDETPRLFSENLQAIDNLLIKKHGFALSNDDLDGIKYVYNAFFQYGPKIQYSSTSSFGGSAQPTYADLMTAADRAGLEHSYLANEENFQFMKDLETRNLLVPRGRQFRRPEGDSRGRQVSQETETRSCRRSICRTSSSISARISSGTTSARTSRRLPLDDTQYVHSLGAPRQRGARDSV